MFIDDMVHSMKSDNNIESMAQSLAHIERLKGLESFVTTKTLPRQLFSHLDSFFEAYDLYIDDVIASEQLRVTCQSGCSACCRYELARGVSALEAIYIYHHVRTWTDVGAVYDACGENMVTFQKLLFSIVKRDGTQLASDDDRIVAAHVAYNNLKRPCAFLDCATGKCRIYPVRPIVCRFFFCLTPAKWCAIDHPKWQAREGRHVNPPEEIKQQLFAINTRLSIRSLNFLSGAFVTVAGEVMNGETINIVS